LHGFLNLLVRTILKSATLYDNIERYTKHPIETTYFFLHLSFFILNIFKSLLIKRKVLYFYGFLLQMINITINICINFDRFFQFFSRPSLEL